MSGRKRVAVIGGGITGLAAAWFLDRRIRSASLPVELRLFEVSASLGGVIRTVRREGFLLDLGPDSLFRGKPAAADLAREIGMGGDLVDARPQALPTLIYSGGRLHPLPEGLELVAPSRILPLLTTGLLSARGKLRMMLEPFMARRTDGGDESIAGFVRRRLGDEAARRIAGPLMAGIHAGDPERLSLRCTFPRLLEMEKAHGSLTLGMRRARARMRSVRKGGAGARPGPPFVSLRGGMHTLVERLAGSIPEGVIAAGQGVRSLVRGEGGWTLHLREGGSWEADACVVAVPAAAAAEILEGADPDLPGILRQVRYASSAVVFLGYRDGPGARLPGATGFLVASDERRSFFGCTFVSNKFDERAPEGTVLVRTFIGGALDEERASLADGPLVDAVRKDLAEIVGLRANPILVHVQRWPKTNPQHEVGHAAKVAAVDRRLASLPGLFVTGSALRGIGIPDGVVMGRDAAGGVLRFLDLDGEAPGEGLPGDLPTEGAP